MVQKSIVYKICKSKTGTSGGDTVNPFNHLKRKHPKEYAESQVTQGEHVSVTALQERIILLNSNNNNDIWKCDLYEKTSKHWKDIYDAVIFYLANDNTHHN